LLIVAWGCLILAVVVAYYVKKEANEKERQVFPETPYPYQDSVSPEKRMTYIGSDPEHHEEIKRYKELLIIFGFALCAAVWSVVTIADIRDPTVPWFNTDTE
jgi:hypothetical protein